MSKMQFFTTRDRGVYDGNTFYQLFDEVLDVAGGSRFMLVASEARGIRCQDRNYWRPVSEFVEPLDASDGLALSIRERVGNGVISGLAVAAQTVADMTVSVTEGVCYLPSGLRAALAAAAALSVASVDVLYNRKGIVYVNAAGELAVLLASGTAPVAGAKTFTITTNAVANDTVTIGGVQFTAKASGAAGAQFNIGADAAATAANFAAVLDANATVGALYDAAAVGAAITLTEKVPGGGNTPADATKTGTIVITNGTATTSAAAGAATAPTLPATGVLLAEIAIARSATSIATGNITKKRKMLVSDAVFKTE